MISGEPVLLLTLNDAPPFSYSSPGVFMPDAGAPAPKRELSWIGMRKVLRISDFAPA